MVARNAGVAVGRKANPELVIDYLNISVRQFTRESASHNMSNRLWLIDRHSSVITRDDT